MDDNIGRELRWMSMNLDTMPDACERVFRATVLLRQANPHRTLAACLEQAIIWEAG